VHARKACRTWSGSCDRASRRGPSVRLPQRSFFVQQHFKLADRILSAEGQAEPGMFRFVNPMPEPGHAGIDTLPGRTAGRAAAICENLEHSSMLPVPELAGKAALRHDPCDRAELFDAEFLRPYILRDVCCSEDLGTTDCGQRAA